MSLQHSAELVHCVHKVQQIKLLPYDYVQNAHSGELPEHVVGTYSPVIAGICSAAKAGS
jgi:hypothetical protein